jgi:methionyl-tRNA formyltransferase
MIRVVFFGMNSEYSILPLLALLENTNVVGAFDLQQKPGKIDMSKSFVKKVIGHKSTGAYSIEKIANAHGVNYHSADHIDGSYFENWIKELKPDLICVAGFSKKVPKSILSIPVLGIINIHTGPLPMYRGAHPFFYLIKKKDKIGGVTIHWMNENFDDGKILKVVDVALLPGMNLSTYNTICGYKAAVAIKEILNKLNTGNTVEGMTNDSGEFLNCRAPISKDCLLDDQLSVQEALWFFTAYSDSIPFEVRVGNERKVIYKLSLKSFEGCMEIKLNNGVVYVATKE